MSIDSMIDLCLLCIDKQRKPDPGITMVVRQGRLPKGFPRGEVLCVTRRQEELGLRAMRFPAMRVLAWALRGGE
jgi:hypothetical protein